jgi:hypothetical protein
VELVVLFFAFLACLCVFFVVVVVVVLLSELLLSAADAISGAPARVAASTASTATLNFIGLSP